MESLLTSLLIAASSFLVSDYLPSFLKSLKLNKIRKLLNRKPFTCPYCLSIWIAITYAGLFDFSFFLYIGIVPVITEGISRHLLEMRL
jgi:hypothetical protein